MAGPAVQVLLAALSGAVGCLSFSHHALTPLVFLTFVPLLVAVSGASARRALVLGWLMGVVGFAGACPWVLPTIVRFERVSTVAAVPFFAMFLAYYGLQIGLFAAGVAWFGTAPLGAPSAPAQQHSALLFVPAWWVVLEWGFPKVIPWSFGDALTGSALLRQGADLAGAYGLSFVIMAVNGLLAAALSRCGMPMRRRLRLLGVAIGVVVSAALYGSVRLQEYPNERPTEAVSAGNRFDDGLASRVTIAVVQGGLQSGRDDVAAANVEAWNTYSSLSAKESVSGADLVVWPETVLRVYLRYDELYRHRVFQIVERLDRPLLVGALDQPARGAGEFNSAYLVEREEPNDDRSPARAAASAEQTGRMQVYHKRRLLPFGEYVPAVGWLPLLDRWRTTGQFIAGKSEPVVSAPMIGLPAVTRPGANGGTRRTTFGPSICFEAVWPGAANHAVRSGAEFLINLTDDGWFGDGAGPYEHLQAARLRAVETRRWMVRASNSGVSAVIDPSGRIVASLPLGTIGVLRQRIEMRHEVSPYVRLGNWPVPVSFVVVVVYACVTLQR